MTPELALHALSLRDVKRRIDAGEIVGMVHEHALLLQYTDDELRAFAAPFDELRAFAAPFIARHAPPASCRIAWSATPKAQALTGRIKPEEKERARMELERAIRMDGFDPSDCEIVWTINEVWGWTARVKENA